MTPGLRAWYRVAKVLDEYDIHGSEPRAAIAAAIIEEADIDVEGLAVAMNTAQVTCEEIRLGRDLQVPAARIVAAYTGARRP